MVNFFILLILSLEAIDIDALRPSPNASAVKIKQSFFLKGLAQYA